MTTKTTMTKAASLTRISRSGVRPATGGNKNVNARARRTSQASQTKTAMVGRSLKGPDLGDG